MSLIAKTTSRLATAFRGGRAKQPRFTQDPDLAPLVLYDFESCPFCRKVREAITDLGLTVDVRPCPKGGSRFREEAMERYGQRVFPFLVDPNAGVEMAESADINRHLYATYGDGEVPGWLRGPLFLPSSQLASVIRGAAGTFAKHPSSGGPVELRCNESDPEARLVRERLCVTERPYRRSPGPLELHDPETDTRLTDVDAILDWLLASSGSSASA